MLADEKMSEAEVSLRLAFYLLAAPDEILPVPTAARYEPAGYYPQAYRVAYDPRAPEFLVGLTLLAPRE